MPPGQERLGPYRVLRRLGGGGMGVVVEAVHESTGGRVAIKRLLPSAAADVEVRLRFVREAQALAALDHPHVLRVHAAELTGPDPYLVLPLLEGPTLETVLRDGPLPLDMVRRLFAEILSGLAHAHARGLVHRDLKPANVLLDAQRRAVLADFGLVRVGGQGSLTRTGAILGSPLWMAPEQAVDSSQADARADVYALGAILYALLSGQPPIPDRGQGPVALLVRIQTERPTPVNALRPDAPPDLVAVCTRALEKDPARRWPDALALERELASLTGGRRPGRRGLLVAASLAALLGAAVWAATALTPDGGPARDPRAVPAVAVPAPPDAAPAGSSGVAAPSTAATPPDAIAAAAGDTGWELIPLLATPGRFPRADFEGDRVILWTGSGFASCPRRFTGREAPRLTPLQSVAAETVGQASLLLCCGGARYLGIHDGPGSGLQVWRDGRCARVGGGKRVLCGERWGDRLAILDYTVGLQVLDGASGKVIFHTDQLVGARSLGFLPDGSLLIGSGSVRRAGVQAGHLDHWRPDRPGLVRWQVLAEVRGVAVSTRRGRLIVGDTLGLVSEFAWPPPDGRLGKANLQLEDPHAAPVDGLAGAFPRTHKGPLRDVRFLRDDAVLVTLAELEVPGLPLEMTVWDADGYVPLRTWEVAGQVKGYEWLVPSPERDQLLLCNAEQVYLLTARE